MRPRPTTTTRPPGRTALIAPAVVVPKPAKSRITSRTNADADAFAVANPAGSHNGSVRRLTDVRCRRPLHEVHGFREREQALGRRQDLVGEPTVGELTVPSVLLRSENDDTVSDFDAADLGADLRNYSGDLVSQHHRKFGQHPVSVPSRKPTSLWQMPAARTSTTTCPGPAVGLRVQCVAAARWLRSIARPSPRHLVSAWRYAQFFGTLGPIVAGVCRRTVMVMEQLTSLDAGFLEVEDSDRHVSMAIGAVAVIEGPLPPASPLLTTLGADLSIPRFRQLLRTRPFDLGAPQWVDDPDFDMARHVHRAALPRPGDNRRSTG